MHDITTEGKDLIIDGEKITFDYELGEVLNVDGVIVIRLKIPPDAVNNRNVFAIDPAGNELWKIPENPKTSFDDDPYMSIYREDEGLWARTWSDWAYRLDPESGDIIDSRNVR